MADQNFRVKRGLEVGVGKTILYADPGGDVGINSTAPTATLDVNGTLNVSGASTFQDNVNLGDNDRLRLGDSNDLEIYHDSSNSYITDSGSGNLLIGSDNELWITNAAGTENKARFTTNGSVKLYYDNYKKFETTNIGIAVSNGNSDTATIAGPTNLIIDPTVVGDNTGLVRIKGDLYVDGTEFIVNSTTIELTDLKIGIATNVGTNLLLDGGGIGIGSDNIEKTILWNNSNSRMEFNADLYAPNFTTGNLNASTLNISGIATFGGQINAGGITGTSGQYLESTGIGVTWASFPTLRVVGINTATAGQTTFNFNYNVDFLDVFVNGVKLTSSEYTATNGTSVVLVTPAFENDIVELQSYNIVSTYGGGGGSYSNTDVDSHLNTGTASSGEVLSWNGSDYDWVTQSGGSGITTTNVVTDSLVVSGVSTFQDDISVADNKKITNSIGGDIILFQPSRVTVYNSNVHITNNDLLVDSTGTTDTPFIVQNGVSVASKVGINTSTPREEFDVRGNMIVSGALQTQQGAVISGVTTILASSANPFLIGDQTATNTPYWRFVGNQLSNYWVGGADLRAISELRIGHSSNFQRAATFDITNKRLGINTESATHTLTVNGESYLSNGLTVVGDVNVSGIITASSFGGDASNLTGLTGASAATYGNGDKGYIDSQNLAYLKSLKPLNIYAWSKNEVDKRNLFAKNILNVSPPQWISLKFFNVYGPNESHKENMISIVLKTFQQIKKNKTTLLFKSYNNKYEDGEQKRDFIYVKDCIKVLMWFLEKENISGIFNVGTGQARTFNDLVYNVYKNLKKNINLKYIDMPKEIKNQYQYHTKADLRKLIRTGYDKSFYSLENGIEDYINNYLNKKNYEIS